MKASLALSATVAAALVAVAGASYLVTRWFEGKPVQPNPAALTTASQPQAIALTSLSLPDTQGRNQPLSQWRGKILVVNFWATWCPPCREEMPGFSRLSTKYADNSVQFVGISIDTLNNVRDFEKTSPVTYPLLIGSMDTVQNTVPIGNSAQALPFTAIFDKKGELHSVKLGRLSEPELERRLNELIAIGKGQ
jgi:thiol-disulfide isomerase/thioredoxin